MKKIISLLLMVMIVLSFSACGENDITTDNHIDSSASQSQNDATDTSSSGQSASAPESTDNNSDSSENTDVSSSTASETTSSTTSETSNPTTSTHTHSFSAATCTVPAKCSCGVTNGSALGHNYSNATCTEAKKCSRCGTTSGSALGHSYSEASSTNGYKVGSIITYRCSLCNNTKTETIKALTLNVYRSSEVSISGWLSQVGYKVNVSGGYGKYEYKFEVYLTENSKSPALTEDFSENNYIGWTSRLYCNGNMLVVTVRDEAGNVATKKVIVE